MNNSKGFTLIELVIVIVILGILAATAAPKFIDLTGDARESVIKGVEGSINSAVEIVHAKALIEGKLSATEDSISAGGGTIAIQHGWPMATDEGIGAALELSTDSGIVSGSVDTKSGYGLIHEDAPTSTSCGVDYDTTTTTSDIRPVVSTVVTGC